MRYHAVCRIADASHSQHADARWARRTYLNTSTVSHKNSVCRLSFALCAVEAGLSARHVSCLTIDKVPDTVGDTHAPTRCDLEVGRDSYRQIQHADIRRHLTDYRTVNKTLWMENNILNICPAESPHVTAVSPAQNTDSSTMCTCTHSLHSGRGEGASAICGVRAAAGVAATSSGWVDVSCYIPTERLFSLRSTMLTIESPDPINSATSNMLAASKAAGRRPLHTHSK